VANRVGSGLPFPVLRFLLLTALGVRQLIISTIPFELYAAVAAGVGLFIAFIGFRNSASSCRIRFTTVTLGNLRRQEHRAWPSSDCC